MQINRQQMSSENGGNKMAKANTADRKTRKTRHTHKRMMKEKNKAKYKKIHNLPKAHSKMQHNKNIYKNLRELFF